MLDVNSLYPSVLHDNPMPYGEPVYFEGKYKQDDTYPLYIQQITCCFKVKENHIPTIQLKKHLSFLPNEYIENSGIDPVCLTLTNIDLKLFFDHYDVFSLKYHCGWKFRDIKGLFNSYIDKWMEVKKQATIAKNFGLRTLAKLQLNSLYGKFATKLTAKSKVPYLGDDDIVHYLTTEEEEKDGIYLPVAIFTTAFAREKTIRTSQAIKEYSLKKYGKDLYCYSDTDSIHCLLPIEELEQFCDIDPIRLGAWKFERTALQKQSLSGRNATLSR